MRSRLLVTLFLAACTRTETVTRFVNLHVTGGQTCKIADGSVGKYFATGDFEPLPANLSQQALQTDVRGQTIDGVPGNVKSLTLLATPSDSSVWLGATLVPDTGDVDMLLLPSASSCALTGNSIPFDANMTFAVVSSHTLITTGTTSGTHSYRMNLDTGRIAQMSIGIAQPRTHAAAAALGDGRAFVIGGVSGGAVQGSVEIYDDSLSDFTTTRFFLVDARSDHGAVALANGNVLVAGGQNINLIAATELLTFDGTQWRATESATPALLKPRKNPYVLRLADGTVLVGGGFDANGPVTKIEFFEPDGSAELPPTTVLSPNGNNAFVALDGGGALFVDADLTPHAWFVASNQVAIPIDPDITTPLTDVKLFAHDKGGALIWTGSSWWKFDPWSGCALLANAPQTGPDASSPVASSDPGLHAWVEPDATGPNGSVVVWRDSTRNEFATEGPYLVTDTSLMSPDALPTPTFSNGALSLSSTQAAFVSDARYLDVAVQVDGAHVVIRALNGEVDVGRDCPIQPSETLYVERHGAVVSFAQGGPLIPCAATIDPTARVAVGVRGNGAARNLVVKRLGTALP